MEYFFQNIKNNIDFFLRQRLCLSRPHYFVCNEDKEDLFPTNEVSEREEVLYEKYDLSYLKSHSTRQNYLENIYTVDILDKFLPLKHYDDLKVLDVGCKNWFYAKGEHSFFKKHCKNLILDGIEIDSNRIYTNLYSRFEVAKYHIMDLDETHYIAGNFLELNKKYDCIIWILPFVVEYPHIKWGLPKKYFQPEKLLMHACNSLKNEGKILIINQGEIEYETQKKLCDKLGIKYFPLGEIKSGFIDYNIPRYAIIIEKS